MFLLILGLVLFLGAHLIPTSPSLRAKLVERMGGSGYKAFFSIVSLLGFTLIVLGVGAARGSVADPQLWSPPLWTRHLAFALMPLAFIALVAAYIPSHIHDKLKHPMLVSIKIWALAHLIANGDLMSLILFGSFLAYAVYDRISVKKRRAMGPLGARQGGLVNDALTLLIGGGLYLAMLLYGHSWLIGVPLLGASLLGAPLLR